MDKSTWTQWDSLECSTIDFSIYQHENKGFTYCHRWQSLLILVILECPAHRSDQSFVMFQRSVLFWITYLILVHYYSTHDIQGEPKYLKHESGITIWHSPSLCCLHICVYSWIFLPPLFSIPLAKSLRVNTDHLTVVYNTVIFHLTI